MATDHLRSAITKHLAPLMAQAGFHRSQPKTFVRVRGEILHAMAFQMSQWGGQAFYLHHSVQLISDPLMKPDSYRVGARIDQADDGVEWHGPDAASAEAAIQSAARTVQARVLPWLDAVRGPADFLAEYIANPQTTLQAMEPCIALLRLDRTDRPFHVCTLISSPNGYLHEPSERDKRQMEFAHLVLGAIERGDHQALLDGWRVQNLQQHKLQDAVA